MKLRRAGREPRILVKGGVGLGTGKLETQLSHRCVVLCLSAFVLLAVVVVVVVLVFLSEKAGLCSEPKAK